MHQVVLKRGTAPDYGTFIYSLKVPHTHPHMSKTVGSHQTWILQLIVFSAVRSKGLDKLRAAHWIMSLVSKELIYVT